MQCSLFLFADPFCTTQKSLSVLVIKLNQLMLYMEIITVCSEINTKHRNTHWSETRHCQCSNWWYME